MHCFRSWHSVYCIAYVHSIFKLTWVWSYLQTLILANKNYKQNKITTSIFLTDYPIFSSFVFHNNNKNLLTQIYLFRSIKKELKKKLLFRKSNRIFKKCLVRKASSFVTHQKRWSYKKNLYGLQITNWTPKLKIISIFLIPLPLLTVNYTFSST